MKFWNPKTNDNWLVTIVAILNYYEVKRMNSWKVLSLMYSFDKKYWNEVIQNQLFIELNSFHSDIWQTPSKSIEHGSIGKEEIN